MAGGPADGTSGKESEMSLNHPSLAPRVLDLERDLLLARAAAERGVTGPRPGAAFRSVVAPARRRLGAALVTFGLRLREASSVGAAAATSPVE